MAVCGRAGRTAVREVRAVVKGGPGSSVKPVRGYLGGRKTRFQLNCRECAKHVALYALV